MGDMQKDAFVQPEQSQPKPQAPEVAKSQVKPEPTKKPYQPEQKYEQKNFRAPLKTPERSSGEHPVIR